MTDNKSNIPQAILERRAKNKHIMESRKNLPKRTLAEIAESFRQLNEETEQLLNSLK